MDLEEGLEDRAVRWMKELQSGSHDAFAEIYLNFAPEIYRFCLRILEDPHRAEDVCQETFLDLYRSAPSYEERGSFRSYLFTLALNRCRKELARRTLQPLDETPYGGWVDPRGTPEGEVMERELWERLQQRFLTLPQNQRFALTLVIQEGLSYEEAARVLSASLAQVKTWVFRGREALRKALAREVGEEKGGRHES